MLGQLVGPDIKEMIDNRQFAQLRRALRALAPQAVAEIFSDMEPEDVAIVFRVLPRDFVADVFEYMPFEAQEPVLHNLGQEHVAVVLNEMDPDDRTELLEELPGKVTQRLISLLSPEERRIATKLLGYPEDSVGRLMTPDYVAVRADWTVGQVLEHIRQVGHDKETLNVIYVVDDRGRLVKDVRLRQLVLSDPDTPVTQIEDRPVFALQTGQDQEEAVKVFRDTDRIALPVVDSTNQLVGIVTVDDMIDVVDEETTEDIQKMAAVTALDAPYLKVNVWGMIRKRATWLSALFIGGMFTISAIAYYEEQLQKALVLGFFIPLIISSGGNSGSQAASLVTRALALGDVTLRDWWRVLIRELSSGLALGAILAVLALLRVYFWPPEVGGETIADWELVALTLAITLVGVVTWGTIVGSLLPILLKSVGLDPAVSSTPFVATLVDVTGIIIYFSVASVVMARVLS
ncbi:MAG: magnesium transporter [Phycisphaerales bacterium]|nr:magnesium transporter [Phycisphaerales bacterium]